jgi:hypothetical protein
MQGQEKLFGSSHMTAVAEKNTLKLHNKKIWMKSLPTLYIDAAAN